MEKITYTVAWHTYYNDSWHMDISTETEQMNKHNVLKAGHEIAAMGAYPLYYEWVNGRRNRMMYEYQNNLEYAIVPF